MIGNFALRISGGESLNPGSLNDDARKSGTRPREIKPEVNKPMRAIRKPGAAVAWLICSAAMAYAQTPTIVSAIVNSATQQIFISGVSLAPPDFNVVVKLDGSTLTLVSIASGEIVAELPAGLAAGTYRLTVNNGSATPGIFDVTNGAVGPAGPAGPAGPQGPAGTITLPFNGSAAGTTNAVFNIINTSAAHSAISGHGAQPSSGNGGNGVGGYGGASNGGNGGSGVYAVGGVGTLETDIGGSGINAQGGNASGTGAGGGSGVTATGGTAVYGGDGIDAYAGAGQDGGNGGAGIFAVGTSGSGEGAGLFYGDVSVSGAISKASGSFKIDHPLDPANKYLYHSFVESPDMMNIYNGNVITDGSGTAVVSMPAWFEALNTDFRYQLTTIGQPAQTWIAAEIANGSFTIKTSKSGVKVSWQVTGIRQDAWANAHRIQVEVEKSSKDQGHYIHPELFGHEGEPSIMEMHHPRPPVSAPEQ